MLDELYLFLEEMNCDYLLLASFTKNPATFLEGTGLSDPAKLALRDVNFQNILGFPSPLDPTIVTTTMKHLLTVSPRKPRKPSIKG
jgi:hypothetical protein